jgi:hypothetical protein
MLCTLLRNWRRPAPCGKPRHADRVHRTPRLLVCTWLQHAVARPQDAFRLVKRMQRAEAIARCATTTEAERRELLDAVLARATRSPRHSAPRSVPNAPSGALGTRHHRYPLRAGVIEHESLGDAEGLDSRRSLRVKLRYAGRSTGASDLQNSQRLCAVPPRARSFISP